MTEGLDLLIDRVGSKSAQLDRPTIVLIAGGSASGKTTAVANEVLQSFAPNAKVHSADDYYRGITYMDSYLRPGEPRNFDDPRAVDLDGVVEDIKRFKRGDSVVKRHYSFVTGEPEYKDPPEMIDPAKVTVIEGLFTLDPKIAALGDVRAFVDIGLHGRIMRRLLRDVTRTKQDPSDILDYFTQMVHPMHEQYVQTTMKNADPGLVLKNEYDPKVESHRSGMYEYQLKFPTDLTPDVLRSKGAERIAKVSQLDRLYNPKDRNLSVTGEMMRIRQEFGMDGNNWLLTYKGPKVEGVPFRQRPKFEFELPQEVAERFVEMYGDEVLMIGKDRTVYRLGEQLFSLDQHVTKGVGENIKMMGSYLEFRMAEGIGVRGEVFSRLNVDMSTATTASYAEI